MNTFLKQISNTNVFFFRKPRIIFFIKTIYSETFFIILYFSHNILMIFLAEKPRKKILLIFFNEISPEKNMNFFI